MSYEGQGPKMSHFIIGVIIIFLVAVVLIFIFKPKQPQVVPTPVNLQFLDVELSTTVKLNMSLGFEVFINNPNFAAFKYGSSASSIYYREVLVGQAPIEAGMIEARSTQNISTIVDTDVEKMIANPSFLPDYTSGKLNFTSFTSVDGRAVILGFLKLHAMNFVSCNATVFVRTKKISSICISTIKI